MNKNILNKILNTGKLLEVANSTEAQKEYLTYSYNNKFYRIVKHMGKITDVIKIKKDYLSELAIYRLYK